MSKIPIDKNGKLQQPLQICGTYSRGHSKLNYNQTIKPKVSIKDERIKKEIKEYNKETYVSQIPKMNMEKVVEQNPRILDLREKLNEITKKQKRNVDKMTKGLINDITQQLVDEKDVDDSGPYSLLFDLQSDPSTSLNEIGMARDSPKYFSESNKPISKSSEKMPNVINFDEKQMKEFEYSCENDFNVPIMKAFNTHSRSELCLQLKSHMPSRPFEPYLSPNDNSLNRNNDENSLDDSLGILTPDQMDDMCYMDNTFSPTVEGLPIFSDNQENKISPDNGDTPSTDKTESNSAESTIHNDGFENNYANTGTFKDSDSSTALNDINKREHHTFQNNPSVSGLFPKNEIIESIKEVSPGLREEDFLPSIHSSILEPISIAESTLNLEIPLGCKHENRLLVNRTEQTPSPEELPLDNSDINGEISTYSQLSASTVHDSQTYSESKTDFPKSMETSKVSNSFITSITSITSLDGYQGDGEMSRPVSRGADHSIEHREDVLEMDWQNLPVTRRTDPMTDSDFFTESDADGLDDIVQRGDRKAQVIDGALYGGKNTSTNPPLLVNRNEDSCMESSGVYTDFENHRSSPVFLNVIDDMSPDGSTPSTRSECSQKNECAKLHKYLETEDKKDNIKEENEVITNASKRNSISSEKEERVPEKNKDEKRNFTLKKYKMPKRDVPSKLKSMLANRKTEVDTSVQNSPKNVKKVDRRENFSKKNIIDLKSDYKTKSFKDIKSKVDCSYSLQRSQTSCNVNRSISSKSTNTNTKPKSRHMRMRIELGSANGSGKSSLHSSQSDISTVGTPLGKHSVSRFPLLRNGKKRESAPTPPTPARPPATPQTTSTLKAKKNGTVPNLASSPVSVRARTPLGPPPAVRKPAPHRPLQRPTTLPTTKEPPRMTAAVGPRGKRVQTPPQPPRTTPPPLSAPLALPIVPQAQTAALAHATKGFEALGVLVQYLVFRLDALNGGSWRLEAERWRSVAAAERSSAERADRDRQQRAQKDLDTIAECLSKISELEVEVSAKEEANARLKATYVEEVAKLTNEIKELKVTIESLNSESRARVHAHSEIERALRAQLEAVRAELDHAQQASATLNATTDLQCYNTCKMCDAACDPVSHETEYELRLPADEELSPDAKELAAEVRSLRAVVELKQAEMASLRETRSELTAEREKRMTAEREARAARHAAEELKERAAARQRESDKLRDDNRRLREAAARDRDQATRLASLNEELRYKLRQKSQVVSLLAGGGYIERSPQMRPRTSSGDSVRSASPPLDSPPSPASSPAPDTPPLPAVKGVVEKHDSVSWVLEIEESPEEVASRLARKSSFRTAASPSGVKRRGGGSPGSGSPAPASPAPNASKLFRPGDLDFPPPPPPLKESAGEAIYIYDDSRY